MTKILITGASGALGKLVISQLLETGVEPSTIVAMVRSAEKGEQFKAKGVEIKIGTYDDAVSLKNALAGVTHALLISSNNVMEEGGRMREHLSFVKAAKESGSVQLLAYTSLTRADTTPMVLAGDHKATEKAIRESGIPFSLLRNGWYFENSTDQVGMWAKTGSIIGATGQGRVSAASRLDYATAAAKVLSSTTTPVKEVYELGGQPGYTLDELAEQATQIIGKPIQAIHMSKDVYEKTLASFGLPALFCAAIADAEAKAAEGALEVSDADLRSLIGRPSQTLEEVMRQAYASGATPAH